MSDIQPLFLGNWKMNLRPAEVRTFAEQFLRGFTPSASGIPDAGFAAPFTSLSALRDCFKRGSGILVGAQNAHWLDNGAHTGEISPPMLKDVGMDFVIIGHSERRQFYGENDKHVSLRAKATIKHGLKAVVCVGETQEQFEANITRQVVESQVRGSLEGLTRDDTFGLIIAYEPVWAIGTGLAATPEIAAKVHTEIRVLLRSLFGKEAGETIPILYGGSTTADNVAALMAGADINGALVGGASLKPDGFNQLIENGRKAAEAVAAAAETPPA